MGQGVFPVDHVIYGCPGCADTRHLGPETRPLRPDPWDPMPATRDPRPVATGTPVDPVVPLSHLLSRSQNSPP